MSDTSSNSSRTSTYGYERPHGDDPDEESRSRSRSPCTARCATRCRGHSSGRPGSRGKGHSGGRQESIDRGHSRRRSGSRSQNGNKCFYLAAEDAAEFCDAMSSSVTILVGEEAQPFMLHETRLTKASGYFKAGLSGAWKESGDRTFRIEEIQPGLFACFAKWFYNGTIEVPATDAAAGSLGAKLDTYFTETLREISETYKAPDDLTTRSRSYWALNTTSDRVWLGLFGAYALGDRLQCNKFKNAVLNDIIGRLQETQRGDEEALPTCQPIRYAFETTPPGAPLRDVLIDAITRVAKRAFMISQFSKAQHPDVILDLGKELARTSMTEVTSSFYISEERQCRMYHEGCERERGTRGEA